VGCHADRYRKPAALLHLKFGGRQSSGHEVDAPWLPLRGWPSVVARANECGPASNLARSNAGPLARGCLTPDGLLAPPTGIAEIPL
jgi:hypothetical protein